MISSDKYILSCINDSALSEPVCDYSAWIAKSVGAPLKLFHSLEQRPTAAVSDLTGAIGLGASEDLLNELTDVEQSRSQLMVKKGNLMLKAAKEKALAAGVEKVITSQRRSSLVEALIDMEDQIRMLVIGTRAEQTKADRKGIGRQLETIIRSMRKPILVVNNVFSPPKKVMLAYDGSEASNKALETVAWNPHFKQIPCHLIHVTDTDTGSDALLNEAEAKLTASGVDVVSVRLHGKIEEVLADYQAKNDIDLTVMGAFSHTKIRGFLVGSFTAKMLEKTQRPLLLLR